MLLRMKLILLLVYWRLQDLKTLPPPQNIVSRLHVSVKLDIVIHARGHVKNKWHEFQLFCRFGYFQLLAALAQHYNKS